MKKFLLSESDKTSILSQHKLGVNGSFNNDTLIVDWLSPDEKYVVFLDELYDIENKTKLGNIWENFDNLKFFLQYSFNVSSLPKFIKEEINSSLNNFILTEQTRNLSLIKEDLKLFLNEGLWSSFKKWAVDTGKSSWEGFQDFLKTSVDGGKELINRVSKGEWSEVFSLIGKGLLYLGRKIRSALYNPIGLILDAILVATGIGKVAQAVLWGIVVATDVYELVSGNYEENIPLWQRLLFLGVDILGLVFAGAAAKSARIVLKPLTNARTEAEMVEVVSKNPTIKGILTKMKNGLTEVPGKLSEISSSISSKFPKGTKFINNVLGSIGGFLTKIGNMLNKMLGIKSMATATKTQKGLKTGLTTAGLVGGVGTYGEYQKEKEDIKRTNIADKIISNPNIANTINNDLLNQLNNL
jgi:hypothetical protein